MDGTDVVYKDIIEPLESASVTISKTDKKSVTEFGSPIEVNTYACVAMYLVWFSLVHTLICNMCLALERMRVPCGPDSCACYGGTTYLLSFQVQPEYLSGCPVTHKPGEAYTCR